MNALTALVAALALLAFGAWFVAVIDALVFARFARQQPTIVVGAPYSPSSRPVSA